MEDRSTYDRTRLADDAAELAALWPALAEALVRGTGGSDSVRVAVSETHLALPLDTAVLRAIRAVERMIPAAAHAAMATLAEPPANRDVLGHLAHLPRLHERLLVTAAQDEARTLARAVAGVLRTVKAAIGLITPDRQLDVWCPLHDEDPCRLMVPGDVGHIRYRRMAAGLPDAPHVVWQRSGGVVVCRQCGATWVPSQYLWLHRLLAEAAERRAGVVA